MPEILSEQKFNTKSPCSFQQKPVNNPYFLPTD